VLIHHINVITEKNIANCKKSSKSNLRDDTVNHFFMSYPFYLTTKIIKNN